MMAGGLVGVLLLIRTIVYGTLTEGEQRSVVLWIILPSIVIGIAGILLSKSVFASNSEEFEKAATYSTIGWILFVCGALPLAYVFRGYKREKAESKAEERRNQLAAFYAECVKNDIHSCNSAKDAQLASLIAQRHKIEYSNIAATFNEASQCYQQKQAADAAQKQQKDLAELKAAEQAQFAALNEFASCWGRNKRIAILTKEYNAVSRELDSLYHAQSFMIMPRLEQEHDWATMGGLANGLAGPGAGIATAVNAQMENAQIRARNEARRKAAAERGVDIMIAAAKPMNALRDRQAELEQKIKGAEMKLVGENTTQQALDLLQFTQIMLSVSKTGTCIVSAKIALKQPEYYIFGNVRATVDGTIHGDIYDGNEKIGTANLVLPLDGVPDSNPVEVKGLCLFCAQPGKHYTLRFSAERLWVMEQ